jgi:hypothetical protein
VRGLEIRLKIINCFTSIFDSKQLKYSPKVYIFALRRENGNSRRNEPLFLVSVDKLPIPVDADIIDLIIYGMFVSWFITLREKMVQRMVGSSSRVYCFFAQLTNSSVLV